MSHKTFAGRMLLATVGSGAVLLGTTVSANAQPAEPNCSAADLAGIMSGVTAATSSYMFANPPVNDFFSNLGDVPSEDRREALESYLAANPGVKAELSGIRQPVMDFRDRCGSDPVPLPGNPGS